MDDEAIDPRNSSGLGRKPAPKPILSKGPPPRALPHRGSFTSKTPSLLFVPVTVGKGGQKPESVNSKVLHAHVQQSKWRIPLNPKNLRWQSAAVQSSVPGNTETHELPHSCHCNVRQRRRSGKDVSRQYGSNLPSQAGRTGDLHHEEFTEDVQERRQHVLCPICGRNIFPSGYGDPQNCVDTVSFDPFGTSIVPISRVMNHNIRYWVEILTPAALPVPAEASAALQQVIPELLRNAPSLWSVVASAAARRQMEAESFKASKIFNPNEASQIRSEALVYHGELVSSLRPLMSDEVEALSTATIFAVNSLLAITIFSADEEAMVVHTKGLANLVYMRGGFHGIPPFLQSMVLSTTFFSAVWTNSIPPRPPYLPPPDAIRDSAAFATYKRTDFDALGKGLLRPSLQLDEAIVGTIRDMCDHVQWKEFCIRRLESSQSSFYIDVKRFDMEYRLITYPGPRPNLNRAAANRQGIIRVALLASSSSASSILPPSSRCFYNLVTQLMAMLLEQQHETPSTDGRLLWSWPSELNDVLLWVLFVGARISYGQRERQYFTRQISRCARHLELSDWEEVKEKVLKTMLFVDRIHNTSYWGIWEESQRF